MLFDLKRCTSLGFLFLQDGYIQRAKLYLLWGVTAVIATLRLSLYPRQLLANQAWLTMSGLHCSSPSSVAMSAATHSPPSFCSQWGEVSTQHPSDPTALEIIPCRNRSLLSNQPVGEPCVCFTVVSAKLDLFTWEICCVLAATSPIIHRNHSLGIAHHLTLLLEVLTTPLLLQCKDTVWHLTLMT